MSVAEFPTLQSNGFVVPDAATSPPTLRMEYEGAQAGRRIGHWSPSDSGPNRTIEYSIRELRARSRQQVRDNPLAVSAKDQYVTNVIGRGIKPNLILEDEDLAKQILGFWDRFCTDADYDDQLDFYGMQALVAGSVFEAGEVLSRRMIRPRSGLAVPIQLQLIESDQLDDFRNMADRNNQKVRMGIEFDSEQKRSQYWMFDEHPQDGDIHNFNSKAIPANEIAHVYKLLRPGQLRGVPFNHAALVRLYELDKYIDAELVRKQQAAMHVGAITAGGGALDPSEFWKHPDTWINERNSFYNNMGSLVPGSWKVLAPGDTVDFNDPQDVGPNYESFIKLHRQDIAASQKVTYEQMTGDMREVNFSSARVRLIDIRRAFEMDQHHLFVHRFCRPVWGWFMDALVAAGRVNIPDYIENRWMYVPEWLPDPFEYVDPEKDLDADIKRIRAGLTSRPETTRRRGRDPQVVAQETLQANQEADQLGFVFDTDARKTDRAGKLKPVEGEETNG